MGNAAISGPQNRFVPSSRWKQHPGRQGIVVHHSLRIHQIWINSKVLSELVHTVYKPLFQPFFACCSGKETEWLKRYVESFISCSAVHPGVVVIWMGGCSGWSWREAFLGGTLEAVLLCVHVYRVTLVPIGVGPAISQQWWSWLIGGEGESVVETGDLIEKLTKGQTQKWRFRLFLNHHLEIYGLYVARKKQLHNVLSSDSLFI